ncbi:MAG: aminotransferase class V-fold PLP-dependent enzyme [Planctomycetota bacterium]
MIYLNHAGTSWPKPECVVRACAEALERTPADWPEDFEAGHRTVAKHLGISDRSQLLLTPGCTSALAVAIADFVLRPGDRILCSSFEHHALHRPLLKRAEQGHDLSVVPPSETGPFALDKFEDELRQGNVKLVGVTAAANVTGDLLPVKEVCELAHQYDAKVLVDGAQVVGWLDLELDRLPIDMFAFGGHKGLQSPWGIGGLYVASDVEMNTPAATCEISSSQPCTIRPDYCDVGSVDRIALYALERAIGWLEQRPQRLTKAREQIAKIQLVTETLPGVVRCGQEDPNQRVPTVAFGFRQEATKASSTEIAAAIHEAGVSVASGLQCAPLAHQMLGTSDQGLLRVSVGPMTEDADIDDACEALTNFRLPA